MMLRVDSVWRVKNAREVFNTPNVFILLSTYIYVIDNFKFSLHTFLFITFGLQQQLFVYVRQLAALPLSRYLESRAYRLFHCSDVSCTSLIVKQIRTKLKRSNCD